MSRGSILVITLVFTSVFLVIFIGLAGLTSRHFHQGALQFQEDAALHLAEAGLHYGRWRLSHDSENFEAESKTISDQFAGETGSFDVSFEPPSSGSTVVAITSTGRTSSPASPDVTLRVRYGIPSFAQFSALFNSDYWFGDSDVLSGPSHSNGGIRMDGLSNSVVSSALETYICQPYHNCNYVEKPGVWGTGQDQDLWEWPVPPVNFNAISTDLLDMQLIAEASATYYDRSNAFGYHLIFHDTNTYSIYTVTSLGPPIYSWAPPEKKFTYTSVDIGTEVLLETKSVPAGGIIYVEDTVWVEGDIRDRVTVAAGVFPDQPSTNADVIINGDLSYGGVHDGSRVLGVIAQRHLLLPWSAAEDVLDMDGAYIAKSGSFGRRYYPNCCGAQAHRLKSKLNIFGMIGLNQLSVDTTYVNGSGTVISGYRETERVYDPNLLYNPPPYFPTTGEYEFLSWERVN